MHPEVYDLFIFIPNSSSLITTCSADVFLLFSSRVELFLLWRLYLFFPTTHKMCGAQPGERGQRRRVEDINKRSSGGVFRGYMSFFCYLASAEVMWLISGRGLQRM